MKKMLVPFISFLIISGCAEQVKVQSPAPIKQEILLERCDDDTPLPQKIMIDQNGFKGYSGSEILKVLTRWDAIYNECALKHDALIKTIRDLQGKDIKINIKD